MSRTGLGSGIGGSQRHETEYFIHRFCALLLAKFYGQAFTATFTTTRLRFDNDRSVKHLSPSHIQMDDNIAFLQARNRKMGSASFSAARRSVFTRMVGFHRDQRLEITSRCTLSLRQLRVKARRKILVSPMRPPRLDSRLQSEAAPRRIKTMRFRSRRASL